MSLIKNDHERTDAYVTEKKNDRIRVLLQAVRRTSDTISVRFFFLLRLGFFSTGTQTHIRGTYLCKCTRNTVRLDLNLTQVLNTPVGQVMTITILRVNERSSTKISQKIQYVRYCRPIMWREHFSNFSIQGEKKLRYRRKLLSNFHH